MNPSRENSKASVAARSASGWRRLLLAGAVLALLLTLTGLVALGADRPSAAAEGQAGLNPELGLFHRFVEDAKEDGVYPPSCAGSAGICTPVIDRAGRAVA